MAVDMFMKIDGIDGESTDDTHKKWIECLSISQSVSQPTSAARSTAGSGTTERASFGDLSVTKIVDSASPKVFLKCAGGDHIKKVEIECCRAEKGKQKVAYWKYELADVVVSSQSISAGGDIPIENLSMNYGTFKCTYTPTDDKTGAAGSAIPASWSLVANKEA